MSVRILVGDCRTRLRELPEQSVHTCVTSPPYFGLRDYGHADQIGLEKTPDAFVAEMVSVFREVKRVLRDDGTLWLNLGDSYNGSAKGAMADGSAVGGPKQSTNKGTQIGTFKKTDIEGLKPKDLIGIPWRVAFALQADGWYLRSDIIWHKPNPMPESVTDRPTKSHEYLFLLAKSERYYFDSEAIAEPYADSTLAAHFGRSTRLQEAQAQASDASGAGTRHGKGKTGLVNGNGRLDNGSRNRRSVWTVPTSPYKGAHFATFPPTLIEPCILASTSSRGCCPYCGSPWVPVVEKSSTGRVGQRDGVDRGTDARGIKKRVGESVSVINGWEPSCDCEEADTTDGIFVERPNDATDRFIPRPIPCTILDPFGGAGTTGLVADRLGRNAILCELNQTYAQMAADRIKGENPMFAEVSTE